MASQKEIQAILVSGVAELAIELPELAIELLQNYFVELCKWNRKINLVAKASNQELIENHFLDSITLLPIIDHQSNQSGKSLLDVGSGAGFPGLVIKIARPEFKVTLLEPRRKRAAFLRHIIRTLGLKGVSVITERLERNDLQFAKIHGKFPLVTSRALTDINDFLAMTALISAPGGVVICMKGPRALDEIKKWQSQTPDSPYVQIDARKLTLPFSGADRYLIVFKIPP